MLKKRFLILLGLTAIVLVSLALSSFTVKAPSASGGVGSGHPDVAWSAQALSPYHLDCFRRELHLKNEGSHKQDASNYFLSLS